MQKALGIISSNLKNIGLDLAPHKTILIHFNKLGIKPGNVEVKINDVNLKSQATVRYLGVIFDYQLSFSYHIEKVKNSVLNTLNIIKFIRGTWCGADPSTLLIIYFPKKRNTQRQSKNYSIWPSA